LQKVYGIQHCEDFTADDMAKETSLSFFDLTHLEPTDLDSFPALGSLTVRGLDAGRLAVGLFRNHPQLTSLSLKQMIHADQIPPGLFQGMPQLQSLTLDLKGTPSATLESLFTDLHQLRVLSLDVSTNQNPNNSIPPGIFRGLDSLGELRISSDAKLESGIMSSLSGVKILAVTAPDAAPGAFSGLSQVTKADFSFFKHALPVGLFADMPALTDLYLYGELGTVAPGTFRGLPALRSLELAGTVSSLSHGLAFDGLDKLEFLKIWGAENSGKFLEPEAFARLTSLKMLNLSNTGITALPAKAFVGMPNLHLLNLARDAITNVEEYEFAPENLSRNTEIYLGFSNLSKHVQATIMKQHGDAVHFDCGDFSLMWGWQYCPID
jgi:Leucine-rich repeat (LRR) protein